MADNWLKALSVIVGMAGGDQAIDDAQAPWQSYSWKRTQVSDCLVDQDVSCVIYNERWDWKRNQTVLVRFSNNTSSIDLHLDVINEDDADTDDVCITTLLIDTQGNLIAAYHQNKRSFHGTFEGYDHRIEILPPQLASADHWLVGTKQCHRNTDKDVYASVLDGLSINAR